MAPNGTEHLQLTYAPMEVYWPRISPDARRVEFLGRTPERGWGIYVVDMTGGDTKYITEGLGAAAWSIDGKSLLVNVYVPGKSVEDPDSRQLAFFDIDSQKVSVIPGSQGKAGAFQALSGMIIASGQEDRLYWFDSVKQKWSVLAGKLAQGRSALARNGRLFPEFSGIDPQPDRTAAREGRWPPNWR